MRPPPRLGAPSLTRAQRLRVVAHVGAGVSCLCLVLVLAFAGYPVVAALGVAIAAAAAAVAWVCAGEKDQGEIPRYWSPPPVPELAERVRCLLESREDLLLVERGKPDPDPLKIADAVGSINALSWSLGQRSRASLTEAERNSVRRFVPIGAAGEKDGGRG